MDELMSDFIGFIINYPESSISVDVPILEKITSKVSSRIQQAGVFVIAI